MSNKYISIVILILFLSCFSSNSYAYNDTTTHPYITEQASKADNSILEQYLKINLGFKYGIETKLQYNSKTRTIKKWLEKGSTDEDDPNCRASNHFHDPLEPWDQSYMSDDITPVGAKIRSHCNEEGWIYANRKSNVTWATGYLAPSPEGAKETFPGFYAPTNWDKARSYYYDALTLMSATERERNYALTFNALGHVLHLIEDMAVPAHVRNDFTSHLTFNGILEALFSWDYEKLVKQPYEYYVENNPDIVTTASAQRPTFNDTRLTDFWDTNQYDGNNPSSDLSLGLAEITNANYFSDSTIINNNPTPEHYYIYPYIINSDYHICEDYIPDSSQYKRHYVSRNSKPGCDKFATVSPLTPMIYFADLTGNIHSLTLSLDDNVHNTYANELIPKAIGYSAALLDYFFRGETDLIKSGSQYMIENLSDGNMEGTLESFQLFYDDINNDRHEITLDFFDENDIPITDPETILTIPAQTLSTFKIQPQGTPPDGKWILVFKGKLGNEDEAVIGKVIDKDVYIMINPADHVTRQGIGRNFYLYNGILTEITENNLPFDLLDDGGYWNSATSDWTDNPDPESITVPLSVGGPQYMAKYWDAANNRVRFIPNSSYEKNSYQDFHKIYQVAGSTVKEFDYVIFEGSPLLSSGKYEENPGYMEYVEDPFNPGTFGVYSLIPVPATDPMQRFFSWHNTINFVGTFLEYDAGRFHRFDQSVDTQGVPIDADAPFSSVVAVSRTGSVFNVETPKIFNYTRPNPYWSGSSGYGGSGVDIYNAQIGSPMGSPASSDNKCFAEDNNCGNIFLGSSSVSTVYNIPYNFNSYVRVHNNDGGEYYEELFINGQLRETSQVSTDKLETHYQILAVYKDIAVVRETTWNSEGETALPYVYQMILADDMISMINPQIYEVVQNFTSSYTIYINGISFDLAGQTTVQSKILDYPYHADFNDNVTGLPIAEYLTFEYVEDITGYHLDRIFISDTFDGDYILVAFDEYDYNNGDGLVHDLNYEESDQVDGNYFMFFDIPPSELQGASHEALPVGRQLLLFRSDGTLVESLQDPIGLTYMIGSIGILN